MIDIIKIGFHLLVIIFMIVLISSFPIIDKMKQFT